MSTDTIAPVEGTGATKAPSMMDLWKASLDEPSSDSDSSGQDATIQQLMSAISSLLPQLLAMLAKGANGDSGGQPSGGGSGSGSGGGMPPVSAKSPTGGGHGGGHASAPPWANNNGGAGGAGPAGAGGAPPVGAAGAGPNVPGGPGPNTPAGSAGAGDAGAGDAGSGNAGATPAATQPTPADPGTGAGSQGGSSGGSGGSTPAASGAPGVSKNAGGVDQASAISGVNPNSVKTVDTGTGSDKVYNVTNSTGRTESFTYSVQGQPKGETITLQPGQTGSFVAGSGDIGVRITPTKADGSASPNEVLYEDGGSDNGQDGGVGNADISKVDGNKDAYGNAMNMTVTLSDGRTAGDGDAIHAYAYSTDDAASMGLAGDPSKTANIDLSDA